MSEARLVSSPNRSSTGGRLPGLPVLLEYRGNGRKWRLSAGILVEAALIGLVLSLPLVFTDSLKSAPPREILPPIAIQKGDVRGDREKDTHGGPKSPRDSRKRPSAKDIILATPVYPVPDRPYLGPDIIGGDGEGGPRLGDPHEPEDGWPPLPDTISTIRTPQPPAPKQPIRISKLNPPRLLHRVEPVYPALARQAGIQGDVVLEALLGEDGRVRAISVKSGHPALIEAARQAVAQWVYAPTYLNDEPYPVLLEVTVRFRLDR